MLAEGGDKARPHLHSESIYKEDEPKVLDHPKHIPIDPRSKVRKEDTNEEDPRHAQRKALDLSLA